MVLANSTYIAITRNLNEIRFCKDFGLWVCFIDRLKVFPLPHERLSCFNKLARPPAKPVLSMK